jgi:hypothetical protein
VAVCQADAIESPEEEIRAKALVDTYFRSPAEWKACPII